MKKPLIIISSTGLFSVLVSFVLLFSCNSNDKKTDNVNVIDTTKKVAAFAEAKSWPYFKLDRVTIQALMIRPDHTPLKFRLHKDLVLQHALYGISDDGKVTVKLWGTALKDLPPHGKLREPFEIPPMGTYKDLPGPVVIGNNRMDWRTIGELIFEKVGPHMGDLKADFGYIVFEPMVGYDNAQHPGCTMCQGHIWYKLTAYKDDGTPYPGWGGGGSGSTNPSPPAEPGL